MLFCRLVKEVAVLQGHKAKLLMTPLPLLLRLTDVGLIIYPGPVFPLVAPWGLSRFPQEKTYPCLKISQGCATYRLGYPAQFD